MDLFMDLAVGQGTDWITGEFLRDCLVRRRATNCPLMRQGNVSTITTTA